jgi:hypothetical protein
MLLAMRLASSMVCTLARFQHQLCSRAHGSRNGQGIRYFSDQQIYISSQSLDLGKRESSRTLLDCLASVSAPSALCYCSRHMVKSNGV